MVPATSMERRRFVDSHCHIWDAGKHSEWYEFPVLGSDLSQSMGWKKSLPEVWTGGDHRLALERVKLVKWVHVTAVGRPRWAVDELKWMGNLASDEMPSAAIGTVDLTGSLGDIERTLDECMSSPLFRGIRVVQPVDYSGALGFGLLQLLAERDLVYNVVSYFDGGIGAITRAASLVPALKIVLEHAGWPSDRYANPAKYLAWQKEIRELAAIGSSFIKLSGLGMIYHRTSASDFLPHLEYCLEHFGAARCMFGSNFPVDAMYGSFSALLDVFEAAVAPLSADEQADAFARTAERVYRI